MLLQEKMEKKTLPFWMAETEAEVTKLRTAAEGRPEPCSQQPSGLRNGRGMRPHQGPLAAGKAADVCSYKSVLHLREQL